MFRKKQKEPKIELYELWSLDHTLARIISRYPKAVDCAVIAMQLL